MQLITYASYSFKNLKHGEKLCIIDATQINELFFPSILENRDGILYDYINEDLNNYNTYNLKTDTDKDLLKRFIDDREALFVNMYCLKLDIDDDLYEFLRFIKEPNVYNYIKDIICKGNFKNLFLLSDYYDKELILPVHFNKKCVDRCIEYITNSHNTDFNALKSNNLQKISIYIAILAILIAIVLGISGIIFT